MDWSKYFSERAKRMKASDIREILAVTQRMDIISFAGGLPDPKTFPTEEIEAATKEILRDVPHLALQYSPTDGVPELREAIANMLNQDGTHWAKENVIVTNGSQQGLDLLGRVFLEPGSKVIVGSPTYLGAIQAFENYLHRESDFVPVRSDDDGMDPDSIRETLQRLRREGKTVKFIYTVPTFQNPAGTVLSAPRRRRVLDLAHEFDTFVVEDDPYGKLRFEGEELPTLASLDREDRVVYLGTFSKILVPGFRLAWTAGPTSLIRQLNLGKQAMDLCTNAFTQFITARLVQAGMIEKRLPLLIELYRKKRDAMMKAMKARMPTGSTWTKSQGGLFTWASVDRSIDTTRMLKRAIQNKVAYVPGNSFFVDYSGPNTMRINFSHPPVDMIAVGVDRLAATLEQEQKETKKAVLA